MEKPQTFRSPTALVVWIVWVLFAVGNWIDLAVQGRDHSSAVAAAILLLATGCAYVTALRPRVIVDDAGVTVKNPVRDHRIAWAAITDVDLMDLLRVHCTLGERKKVISAWAVHYSRRRQFSADVKARRAAARSAGGGRPSLFGGGFTSVGRGMSYGAPPVSPGAGSARDSSTDADAKMIVRLISERATAARAEALWAASPSDPAPASAPASTADPASLISTANPAATAATTATASSADAATTDPSAPSATVTTDAPAASNAKLLTSTWSNSAIAVLVVPALILLIVILL